MQAGTEGFTALRDEWRELAPEAPSPFLTHEWLTAWWAAFGDGELVCTAIRDGEGRLRAAACLARTRFGGLAAPANDHSGDWDVVADGEQSRAAAWRAIADLGA